MNQVTPKVEPEAGPVKARILPKGAGMVFTGALEEGVFITHPKGATITLEAAQARELEDRGLVEIL